MLSSKEKQLSKLIKEELIEKINSFRNARNWKQFHNPKDISLSLISEACEVMEHFQWLNEKEMKKYINKNKTHIGYELADVLYCVLVLCSDLDIDIIKSFKDKMKENNKKYPVKKCKNKNTKYTKL